MTPLNATRRQARLLPFRQPWRDLVGALTCCNASLEDLAESFPGLLFALVSGYGDEKRRQRCAELVMDGAPLRQAARALGLPWWLRKLPAAAFTQPLAKLADDPAIARRMASLVPPALSDRDSAMWLHRVLAAEQACHERFALWIARHKSATLGVAFGRRFFLIAAWAWYSERPDTFAHRLIAKPWHPRMGLRAALNEAEIWRQHIELAARLGEDGRQPWFDDGSAHGYDFVALRTVEDFLAEAEAMRNCLDQYASELADGLSHVISIRKNGERVADLEIVPDEDGSGLPAIKQLRGPRNARAHPQVWRATRAWLAAQPCRPHPVIDEERARLAERRMRLRIWMPYLEAFGGLIEPQQGHAIVSGRARRGSTRLAYALAAPVGEAQPRPQRRRLRGRGPEVIIFPQAFLHSLASFMDDDEADGRIEELSEPLRDALRRLRRRA